CVMVHIMAGGSLCRAPVASAVVGDDSKTAGEKEHHLGLPVIGGQRPTMRKNNRLTGSPIFIEYGDAIFGRYCVHFHVSGVMRARARVGRFSGGNTSAAPPRLQARRPVWKHRM